MVLNPTIDDLKKVCEAISKIESDLEISLKNENHSLTQKVLIDKANYQIERLINDLEIMKRYYFKNLGINY